MSSANDLSSQNPWPGLQAYAEEDRRFFYGRDGEIDELLWLVKRNVLTVVFGPSGTGKSSLVQAGLFWKLHSTGVERHLIRLNHGGSLIGQVRSELSLTGETLWEGFHRLPNPAREIVRFGPVVAFDQFEEIFTLGGGRPESDEFFTQLADLVENYYPASISTRLNSGEELDFEHESQYYRILLIVRKDFVGFLDALRDRMPSVMRARFEVEPFREHKALEAVEKPGHEVVDFQTARQIVRFATSNRGPKVVDPAILCLLCRELNRERSSGTKISPSQLEGDSETILSRFWNESIVSLPEPEREPVQTFIEDRLVSPNGFRTAAPREEVASYEIAIKSLIDGRLLRAEDRFGSPHLELTHDVLCPVVSKTREERRQRTEQAELMRKHELERFEIEHKQQTEKAELERQYEISRLKAEQAAKATEYRLVQTQAKNNRIAAALLATLAVVAIAAAIMAFQAQREAVLLRHNAEKLRQQAESSAADARGAEKIARNQERIAKSEELAFGSLFRQDTDFPLASLLAIEALRSARSFEARKALLEAVQARPRIIAYLQHRPDVSGIAFSPDGRKLATASDYDGTIRFWDPVTHRPVGAEIRTKVYLQDEVRSKFTIAFSANGKILAAGGIGGIQTFNADTGRQLDYFEDLGGNGIAISPDGRLVAVGGHDYDGSVWDVRTHARLSGFDIKGPVAFSPDGRMIATRSLAGLQFWNVETHQREGKPLPVFPTALSFTLKGDQLAIGDDEGNVSIWDIATRTRVAGTLKAHNGSISGLAFNKDGNILISAGDDGIRLYDRRHLPTWQDTLTDDGVEVLVGHDGAVNAVAFSPDGNSFASAGDDGTAILWHTETPVAGEIMGGAAGDARSPLFSPNSGFFATRWNGIEIWDLRSKYIPGENREFGDIDSSFSFSPDNKLLAASVGSRVEFWSVTSRNPGGGLPVNFKHPISVVRFLPNGILLTIDHYGTAQQWDMRSGRQVGSEVKTNSTFLAITRDGDLLTVDKKVMVQKWNIQTGQPIGPAMKMDSPFLATTPDGELTASRSYNTIQVWNTRYQQNFRVTFKSPYPSVEDIALSPDGNTLAAVGYDGPRNFREGTIRLWNVADHRLLGAPLRPSTSSVKSVAFSPNGEIFAASYEGNEIELWDLKTLRSLGEFMTSGIVGFSPDGKKLAATGESRTSILDVDEQSWASRACQLANRNLSLAEWRQYVSHDASYHRTCPWLPNGEGVPAR